MTLEKIDTIPQLPARPRDSHKGRFGSVLIVAGSRGMAGTAALCGGAGSSLGCGTGQSRYAQRSPADGLQLRTVIYDLSPTW